MIDFSKMLSTDEYDPFYRSYIKRFEATGILSSLASQKNDLISYMESLSEKDLRYAYEKNKWSIAEVLVHVFDAERVFSFRTLSIARGEKKSLPGFDQDDYVIQSFADSRTKDSLISEFSSVRASTISLFSSLQPNQWANKGIANESIVSIPALGYIILGHCDHHLQILKERYNK